MALRVSHVTTSDMDGGEAAEASALVATLFEALPVGVLAEDSSRNILAVNDQFVEMFAFSGTRETLIGWDCVELGQQASSLFLDASGFVAHTNELVETHEGLQSEEWSLVDGRTFTRTYRPINLPGGEGHLWVYQDITEKTTREEQLQETTSRLEALYEHSPDMIDVLDSEGTLLDVNARFCEELGYVEDEVLGRPIWEFDLQVAEAEVLELLASFAEDERRKFDGVYERRDGSRLPVEVHFLRLDLDGDDRFLAISRDISERKAFEVGLNALHDTAQEMLQAPSDDQVAEMVNDAVADILEMPINGVFFYDEAEHRLQPAAVTTQGKQIVNELPSFGPGSSLAWEVFESGETRRYQDVSTEAGRYNAETPFRSELIVPLGGHGIILIGSLEVGAFDAQDQSLVETLASHAASVLDRLSRERELEMKNERLDEFASVVSHDLRNPLNVASGRLELAREDFDSEDLQIVARALERSHTLIDDLRMLARSGSTIGSSEAIDLANLSEQCWQTIETSEATLSCDSTLRFVGDRSRVRQLVENLFRNAIEHGGDSVTITVGDLDDGFFIQDNGAGIPVEDKDSVFEAGYTTTAEGTGFGLNIAEQIAEAHDWETCVCSSPSGGARFEFTNVTSEPAT